MGWLDSNSGDGYDMLTPEQQQIVDDATREAQRMKPVINVIEPVPPRPADVHPCVNGHHRAAWLVDGGVACGYCGVRLG